MGNSYVLVSVRELAKRPLPPDNVVSLWIEAESLPAVDAVDGIVHRIFDLLGGKGQEALLSALLSIVVMNAPDERAKDFMKDFEMLEKRYEEGTLLDEMHRQWARICDEEQEKGLQRGRVEGRGEERARHLA